LRKLANSRLRELPNPPRRRAAPTRGIFPKTLRRSEFHKESRFVAVLLLALRRSQAPISQKKNCKTRSIFGAKLTPQNSQRNKINYLAVDEMVSKNAH